MYWGISIVALSLFSGALCAKAPNDAPQQLDKLDNFTYRGPLTPNQLARRGKPTLPDLCIDVPNPNPIAEAETQQLCGKFKDGKLEFSPKADRNRKKHDVPLADICVDVVDNRPGKSDTKKKRYCGKWKDGKLKLLPKAGRLQASDVRNGQFEAEQYERYKEFVRDQRVRERQFRLWDGRSFYNDIEEELGLRINSLTTAGGFDDKGRKKLRGSKFDSFLHDGLTGKKDWRKKWSKTIALLNDAQDRVDKAFKQEEQHHKGNGTIAELRRRDSKDVLHNFNIIENSLSNHSMERPSTSPTSTKSGKWVLFTFSVNRYPLISTSIRRSRRVPRSPPPRTPAFTPTPAPLKINTALSTPVNNVQGKPSAVKNENDFGHTHLFFHHQGDWAPTPVLPLSRVPFTPGGRNGPPPTPQSNQLQAIPTPLAKNPTHGPNDLLAHTHPYVHYRGDTKLTPIVTFAKIPFSPGGFKQPPQPTPSSAETLMLSPPPPPPPQPGASQSITPQLETPLPATPLPQASLTPTSPVAPPEPSSTLAPCRPKDKKCFKKQAREEKRLKKMAKAWDRWVWKHFAAHTRAAVNEQAEASHYAKVVQESREYGKQPDNGKYKAFRVIEPEYRAALWRSEVAAQTAVEAEAQETPVAE
ncbi:uncharacterized protein IWZ02DRAFT_512326 [Phyllosticta citriasiana]|uniref:uncharacterized protein n=1 Tax=Phyllosticta citriasiana TaxID=595635 RepID=UPI0030FD66AB